MVYLVCFKVNMIVLGKDLGIPKPFGPKVDGQCVLEAEMRSLMEGLGLKCTFIDNFAAYHKLLGEVHCGSNVRREMFDFKWWNLEKWKKPQPNTGKDGFSFAEALLYTICWIIYVPLIIYS